MRAFLLSTTARRLGDPFAADPGAWRLAVLDAIHRHARKGHLPNWLNSTDWYAPFPKTWVAAPWPATWAPVSRDTARTIH